MDIFQKAKLLCDSGRFDSCGPKTCEVRVDEGLGGIYYAKAEHKTCRLFKTLMENSCSFDCRYCANASGCGKQKASYEPKELAELFIHLHRTLAVDGLFLSSGVAGDPDRATEKMLEAVRIIRFKHGFLGYIHFKVLPGTSYALIKQASELSNRMSINLEAPSSNVLSELSSCKDYRIDILRRQRWISRMCLSGGQTTQMIINRFANDKDVMRMVGWEYDNFDLRRIYFSAFSPVNGTPLQDEPAEPLARQNHLYNVDFLLREYGFKLKELYPIMESGMLPKNEDPKLALAKASFDGPLDINGASYDELIRVPGIGPVSARRIVESDSRVKTYAQLQSFGARVELAKPFIVVDGKRQKMLCEF